jgi:hypothetical protein
MSLDFKVLRIILFFSVVFTSGTDYWSRIISRVDYCWECQEKFDQKVVKISPLPFGNRLYRRSPLQGDIHWGPERLPWRGEFSKTGNVRQRTVTTTGFRYAFIVAAFHKPRTKKGKTMKNLKLLAVVAAFAALAGCISIGSKERGPQGPPGPKGESGATEKVIVVPEKTY